MIKDIYGNTRFYGIYRGVVFSTDDPLGKNRIRVKVPQILADIPTQWAWPVGIVGSAIPEVGTGVWVQFEGGDPAYPIWAGVFSDNIASGAGSGSGGTSTLTNSDITAALDVGGAGLPASSGGTGINSYAIGDLLYADTVNTLARLAAAPAGNVVISGGVTMPPSYGKVILGGSTTHVSGQLGLSNGGSGAALTAAAGGIVYSTTSAMAITPAGSSGQVLQSTGTGAPVWSPVGTPTGAIIQYAVATPPTGWLACNGGTFSSNDYPALATLLGDTYGVHSGTTYYLPDLRGRVPVGAGSVTDVNSLTQTFALGDKLGELKHTIASTELPQHTHANALTGTTTFAANGHTHRHMAQGGLNSGAYISINAGDGNLDAFGSYNFYTIVNGTAWFGGGTGGVTYELHYVTSESNSSSASVGLSNGNNSAPTVKTPVLQPYTVVNYIIKT